MEQTTKANPSVIIPETLAVATVRDVAAPAVQFGINLVQFEHKGRKYQLDTAVVVGEATKRLMSLSVYCKLHGVSKKDNAEAFKKLVHEYDKVHKPAFWAWFNEGLQVAQREMQPNSIGFRQRLDGSVRATFGFVAPAKQNGKPATEAGRFIANGGAKEEEQSKGKAKRQSKGKGNGKAAEPTAEQLDKALAAASEQAIANQAK